MAQENGTKIPSREHVASSITGVTAYLDIEAPRAQEAIDWYCKVLGYELIDKRLWPKRKAEQETPLIMHAQLKLGSTQLMLADHYDAPPEMITPMPPTMLKGTTVTITVDTTDPDSVVARAVDNGAKVSMPVMDMDWGGKYRYGQFQDPFGHAWAVVHYLGGEGKDDGETAEQEDREKKVDESKGEEEAET